MFSIGPRLNARRLQHLTVGNNINIGSDARLLFIDEYAGQKYQPGLIIGSNVDIGNRFSALSAATITIGDGCLIASDVLITSENHGINPEGGGGYMAQPLVASPVTIGRGCWIGEKVSIMPGVVLGNKCVVGANSVVTKSFPDYCIIGGIPARIIKKYDFIEHRWVRPE